MKRSIAFLMSLGLLLVSCTSPQPVEPTASSTDLFDTPWEDRSIFQGGLTSGARPVLEGLDGASVYHIELNIAEDLFHLSGHQDVRYTNSETVSLNDVQFRLFPNLLGGEIVISNLLVDGQSVMPQLQLENSLLIVRLAAPLPAGSSVVIGMDFQVTIPQDIELNYGLLSYFDGVLALAHAYPVIPVYDDEGWNVEIPARQGDITYTDPSFYLVKITAPATVTVVPSGRVVERLENGGVQSLSVASGPARDFFVAASPDYEEMTETFGEVTIRSYARDALETGSRAALEIAADSLELFNSKYPPYPYTELDIAATPTQAGGIEYPGLIVITTGLYEDNDPGTRQTLEGVVVHEVAHQWFYNLVGGDQLDDPWLDEALAQYLTYEYFTDQYGPGGESGFRSSLEARWRRVEFADIPIGLPVIEYEGREYGAIVYGRGPLFFIALRDQMGQEAFDAFLREYTEQLSWGIATPEFLQTLAEQHCACDLDAMFEEWVYP